MKMRTKELRNLKSWTQDDLAEHASVSRSYIGAIESQNIDKSPSMDTLIAIASALDVRVGDLFDDNKLIPVLGHVGAGAEVNITGVDENPEGLYSVACPNRLYAKRDQVAAVEIVGDSMLPNYQQGDILFYTREAERVPSEAIGRICICHDDDDSVWVKHLQAGEKRGTFDLISLNRNNHYPPRYDVILKWATPVILHWPKELVERE